MHPSLRHSCARRNRASREAHRETIGRRTWGCCRMLPSTRGTPASVSSVRAARCVWIFQLPCPFPTVVASRVHRARGVAFPLPGHSLRQSCGRRNPGPRGARGNRLPAPWSPSVIPADAGIQGRGGRHGVAFPLPGHSLRHSCGRRNPGPRGEPSHCDCWGMLMRLCSSGVAARDHDGSAPLPWRGPAQAPVQNSATPHPAGST